MTSCGIDWVDSLLGVSTPSICTFIPYHDPHHPESWELLCIRIDKQELKAKNLNTNTIQRFTFDSSTKRWTCLHGYLRLYKSSP
jgi:hypothetical protein